MKDIKNYVCTFKQSIILHDLGIDQDSLFYWVEEHDLVPLVKEPIIVHQGELINFFSNSYSAFTSQELGKLINKKRDRISQSIGTNFKHFPECWSFFFNNEIIEETVYETNVATEAQARADFLIYLLENKAEIGACK